MILLLGRREDKFYAIRSKRNMPLARITARPSREACRHLPRVYGINFCCRKAMQDSGSRSFMDEAARLAIVGMKRGDGGPFGAVIVRQGAIIGQGWNKTFLRKDPSAHAEIQAIRDACARLDTLELSGAAMYCSGEPCPMCLSAIYWAMLDAVYFANTREQAALCGFDDAKLYAELRLPWKARALSMAHMPNEQAQEAFRIWEQKKANALTSGKML